MSYSNTEVTDQSIRKLKKEVESLENISENAIEDFEYELSKYSAEFSAEHPIEIFTLTPDKPLICDIKKIL